MAGMLPGVESARRRRFHQSASPSSNPSTRRPSFSLFATNHDSLISSSSSLHRSILYRAHADENMAGAAREAKQRLDDKFRTQRKSEDKRSVEGSTTNSAELHKEVYGGSVKNCSRRFSWTKLSWKASQQDECAVCLELFKVGERLMQLPCAHRFHFMCMQPWLQNNSHCPCCRTTITSI